MDPGHPEDGGLGEDEVAGEDGVEVAVLVAPLLPPLHQPGEHPGRGVVQAVRERRCVQHVDGDVGGVGGVELEDVFAQLRRGVRGDRLAGGEVPVAVVLEHAGEGRGRSAAR